MSFTCPCCGAPWVPDRIVVDLPTNTVTGPRGSVVLQARSAELAAALLRSPVMSRTQLTAAIWGGSADCVPRATLDSHIHHLRHGWPPRAGVRSIGLDVENVRGQGYRLVEMTAERA